MRSTSALVSGALLCSSGIAVAQHAPVTWRATAKNAVYVELLGNGGLLSYNVDRKLKQTVTARFAYGKFSSIELGDQPTESYQTFTAMINALARRRVGPFREDAAGRHLDDRSSTATPWWWTGVAGRTHPEIRDLGRQRRLRFDISRGCERGPGVLASSASTGF